MHGDIVRQSTGDTAGELEEEHKTKNDDNRNDQCCVHCMLFMSMPSFTISYNGLFTMGESKCAEQVKVVSVVFPHLMFLRFRTFSTHFFTV